jgi:Lrp/AsnC family transcriptional regulator
MDRIDQNILRILQDDASTPVSELAKRVGLTTTPCWRRIQRLEEEGVIVRRVSIIDPTHINAAMSVFVSVKATNHAEDWLKRFAKIAGEFPEVVQFYRMSGDVDYLLHVVVPNISAYHSFYRRLTSKIDIDQVFAMFAMERMKFTTKLPLDYVVLKS